MCRMETSAGNTLQNGGWVGVNIINLIHIVEWPSLFLYVGFLLSAVPSLCIRCNDSVQKATQL